MFCTGCGTPSGGSDVLCNGCGVAQHHANDDVAPPAKAVFNLGAAMRRQATPGNSKRRRWGACTCALLLLIALYVLSAAI
jgi:hypothetical protein